MKPAIVSQSVSPDTIDTSVPRLNVGDFERLIVDYGYNVLLERATKCPCRTRDLSIPRNSCQSCNGLGFVYLDKVSTRCVIQSLGKPFEIQNWTEASKGLVKITARYLDRLSIFDKITLMDVETIFTQVLNFVPQNKDAVAYCTYPISAIQHLLLFEREDLPLKELEKDVDFTVTGSKITISKQKLVEKILNEDNYVGLTIRYTCNPQYIVFDIPRDMMQAQYVNCNSELINQNMPINAMGRQLHYTLENER